ncbi:MAG TPA: hypothetical protein VFV74_09970 [Burkholderiales bacterium]|nr:hypothetical protein [Burkholderiales bacterium]
MLQASKEIGRAGLWGAGVVSVFESTAHATRAIERLERGGFDMSKVSVIGKEAPSAVHQMGIAVAGAQARVWGLHSVLWDRLAQAPAAMALTWVPRIGYVMAVGPAACVLLGSRWQAQAPHASALERMLTLSGMSPGETRTYEDAVLGGQLLLLVHGGSVAAARARQLLKNAA